MLTTPKPARRSVSLGEPSRVLRARDQSPGGESIGSGDDPSQPGSAVRNWAGADVSLGTTGGHGDRQIALSGGMSVPRQALRPGPGGRHSRDPRPVGDRAYTIICARNVTEFLTTRGYPKTISADKFLRDPSTKEYFDIFKFLFAQLDPQLEIDGPMELEVPLIMRRLRYPVEVNKSKLQAISGPNTWPQLLAVLDWFIGLIRIHDEFIQPVAECLCGLTDTGDSDCDEGDHRVLRSLHDNYLQYLEGRDGRAEDERLRQIYQERINALGDEIQRLHDQHETMSQRLREFLAEHDKLLELQQAPKKLELEAIRLRGVIQSRDAQVQRLEEEAQMAEGEEAALVREIEGLVATVKQRREQVASQECSKKDIERLRCERSHLRAILENLRIDAEKSEQDVWELSMKDQAQAESIGRLIRSVNDTMEGCGQDCYVRIDLASEPTDALANLDFVDERQKASTAATGFAEALQIEEATHHDLINERRLSQEEVIEKERECQRLQIRLEQLERIREENSVWSAAQLDDAQRTAEETEDAVHQASLGNAGPTVRDAAEVDELKLALSALRTQGAQEKAQLKENLRRDNERAEEHRKCIGRELDAFVADMESLSRSVEETLLNLDLDSGIFHEQEYAFAPAPRVGASAGGIATASGSG